MNGDGGYTRACTKRARKRVGWGANWHVRRNLGHLTVLGGGRSPESLSTGQGGGEERRTTGIVPNVRGKLGETTAHTSIDGEWGNRQQGRQAVKTN